jgi:hypothetical protein
MRSGQRLGRRRKVADECRLEQGRLDDLPEQLDDQLLRLPVRVNRNLATGCDRPQGTGIRVRRDVLTHRLGKALVDRQPAPFPVEVDLSGSGVDDAGTKGIRRREDYPLHQVRHRVLVAEGFIGL